MKYICNICKQVVISPIVVISIPDLRDHLEMHNPNARQFDAEQVLEEFTTEM